MAVAVDNWLESQTLESRGVEQVEKPVLIAPPSGAVAANFPAVIPVASPPTFEQLIQLKKLEAAIGKDLKDSLLDIEDCTSHFFSDGIYCRKWTQPAGTIAVSKTHAKENFLLLVAGEALITTPTGSMKVCAPFMVKTMPGVKRAVYGVTDVVILTFHPNPDNERDMRLLEDRFIIPEVLGEVPMCDGRVG